MKDVAGLEVSIVRNTFKRWAAAPFVVKGRA